MNVITGVWNWCINRQLAREHRQYQEGYGWVMAQVVIDRQPPGRIEDMLGAPASNDDWFDEGARAALISLGVTCDDRAMTLERLRSYYALHAAPSPSEIRSNIFVDT